MGWIMENKTVESRSNQEKLQRAMKQYEKLGAKKFQKIVLQLEQMKYHFLKKFFPHLPRWYEKKMNQSFRRNSKKCKNQLELKALEKSYQTQKRMLYKSWNHEKNRNYHLLESNSDEFLQWLKWNKNIHVKALAFNCVLIPLMVAGAIVGTGSSAIICFAMLIYQIISAGINFSCINLQNYNYCRVMLHKEKIDQLLQKRRQLEIKKYDSVAQKLHPTLEKSKDTVTNQEIIDSLTTVEDLKAMKKLLQEEYGKRPSCQKNPSLQKRRY